MRNAIQRLDARLMEPDCATVHAISVTDRRQRTRVWVRF